MRTLRRWLPRLLVALLAFAALAAVAVFVLLRTQWLREQVRLRIIAEAEKATGGKVELGRFDFDPSALRFEVRDFVLRGREPVSEEPFVRILKIEAGLTVVSFTRKDAFLNSLSLDQPRIRIVTYADGTTNIPGPKVRREGGKTVFEQFVNLGARQFAIANGVFSYDHRRWPLDLRAENLRLQFAWQREGPRYVGKVSASPFHFHWPRIAPPLVFDADVELAMERDELRFTRTEVRRGKSRITATGTLRDYRTPTIELAVTGDFPMAEWVKETRLPLSPEGNAQVQGTFRYGGGRYTLDGALQARGLAVRQRLWAVAGFDSTADFHLEPDLVTFEKLRTAALGGEFQGSGEIRNWRSFAVRGAVTHLSLEQLHNVDRSGRRLAWSAMASGPVELSGSFAGGDLAVNTALALAPAEGRIPLEGLISSRYDQRQSAISFEDSFLKTPRTRIDFAGAMGGVVEVRLDSTDLNELLPAIALVSENPPAELPIQLDGGAAHFDGRVSAVLTAPRIEGRAALSGAIIEKRRVEKASATIVVDANELVLRDLRLQQGPGQVEGQARVALDNWRLADASALNASLRIRDTAVKGLLEAAATSAPLSGTLAGTVEVTGTVGSPGVAAALTWSKAVIAEEPFEQIRANVQLRRDQVELTGGVAEHAAGKVPFSATYAFEPDRIDRGRLRFRIEPASLALGAIQLLKARVPELQGEARIEGSGALRIEGSTPVIESIAARVGVDGISVRQQPFGALQIDARTQSGRVLVDAAGNLFGSAVKGNGEWQLTNDAAGLGTLELGTFPLAKVNDVLRAFGSDRKLPLDGSLQAEIVISGALRRPNSLRARANLTQLRIFPRSETPLSPAVLEELTLRNVGPIVLQLDPNGLQVAQATLTGRETNLTISGALSPNARSAWNLTLQGGLNLGIFQNYVAGLKTSGAATVNATVRGTLEQPLLGGRMEIRNAYMAHRDIGNTIEGANGLVVFDRNRALLQNLTAQTGGGTANLGGFVAFGGEDQITYRLNGKLERVRVRYPEGASTTVNADVALSGTSDQSLVSGNVTILRSGFNTRTDLGSMLFNNKPVQTPTSSTLLRGMQFDVRLINGPNLLLETSLTRGVQAEVDLRLRGSPSKPVLLGTVSVTQGELNFFGTNYTITRGTVSFFNAARIDPVLDLDLETIVRAVTVNMNVSGSVDKPNITYRSDPPLQPSEIVALLAVGRAPTGSTLATQSSTNVGAGSSSLFAGTDTLVGQALSAGLTSPLQRFFGVSRVKIDPQQVGLETTPQARLTIEQQISPAVTLTYVTNLTGALQQLVRLQWDFKRNWSVTVVRDEAAVVGADVQFRKRFK